MACDLETLSAAPACQQWASPSKQLQMTTVLLCSILEELDPEFTCDWDATLASAEDTGLGCLSPADLRAKSAQIVCEGLEVDCDALHCFTPGQLEAIRTYLVCRIIQELNP